MDKYYGNLLDRNIMFFDPSDLGAVALGELETWDPQPYATLTLDDYMFDPDFDYERGKRYIVGAVAFDSQNGFLYIVERLADEGDRSLIHVLRLN